MRAVVSGLSSLVAFAARGGARTGAGSRPAFPRHSFRDAGRLSIADLFDHQSRVRQVLAVVRVTRGEKFSDPDRLSLIRCGDADAVHADQAIVPDRFLVELPSFEAEK